MWSAVQEALLKYLEKEFPGATLSDLEYTLTGNSYTITYSGKIVAVLEISSPYESSFEDNPISLN